MCDLMDEKTIESIKRVVLLIEQMRGENGCPWVKKQTFQKHLEEVKDELRELEDAFKNGDNENLKEELGDVLWDVLTLIRISEDEYAFKTKDIADGICEKIIRRKPYIFGNEKAETVEEAVAIWKRIKEEEKNKH
ncbi:MAG: nucleotide pyrophosphohydrolase [Candidatus Aenigmarchaeota archaeon CG_4_10_14_0_8_um_filter_37_24]|nr:MAG: nucleotide pyrophosphohydrolase [Candidatus Aenigmarchaeota archaeon CG15_BIG_FIL_POST_REV_8_21_14_020_37_27]PIX50519.1 MAG: nucleotide pyrophosphohydrolase [Candidatus Aenigmarchaeota archaeon CG_4_8_14_3_um_filter_37_24]PIY35290.1 MAG: nucleotide pyrophosphohydrolase [Candidatus Aenigmarchaeota archaeon CG_4_10_14_3_um_filter_37_21]PIZ36253.1 MAG: nucleotide pyrophosphohydrolase [Candidatus Aenigmarchaeota archaeon CG_4_10_14_0_8_um_filter_37_24]PJB75329.1 MAG: nucleotide pyrophosphoh